MMVAIATRLNRVTCSFFKIFSLKFVDHMARRKFLVSTLESKTPRVCRGPFSSLLAQDESCLESSGLLFTMERIAPHPIASVWGDKTITRAEGTAYRYFPQ